LHLVAKADAQKVDFFFSKAIEADTTASNKVDYARRAADFFKKSGNLGMSSNWYQKILLVKPRPSNVDYFNAGLAFYNIQDFVKSDSLFSIYKLNYPKDNVGYLWSFRSRKNIDTSMAQGLAVPAANELLQIIEVDKVKFKNQIIEACNYLASYHANIKSDDITSVKYFEKILEVDPGNLDAQKFKDILMKRIESKSSKK
jgi:tetratricopeptide (TPR) repeat protein